MHMAHTFQPKFATTSRASTTSSVRWTLLYKMTQTGFYTSTLLLWTYPLCIPNQISPSPPSAKNLHFLTKNPKWCTALLHLGKRNNEIYIHVYSYLAKMRERGRDCVHLTQGWGNPLLFSPPFYPSHSFSALEQGLFLLNPNSVQAPSIATKSFWTIQKMNK